MIELFYVRSRKAFRSLLIMDINNGAALLIIII